MTLDEAQALSARIHAAAKELNAIIYEANASGLDVDLEIAETLVVHSAPIKTVQTRVSLPLDVKTPAVSVVNHGGWVGPNAGIDAARKIVGAGFRDAQRRGFV